MNLSEMSTKNMARLLTVFVFPAIPAVWTCIQAQEIDRPLPVLTLQERMQKSVSRQMDAVAAMQRSIETQQQTVLRQKSTSSGDNFFTLPSPTPMSSPFQRKPLEAIESTDESDGGNNRSEQSQPIADPPEPDRTAAAKNSWGAHIEIPWKAPASAPLSIALPADIVGINGIDGMGAAGDLSLEGILLRQFTGAEQDKPTQPLLFPALLPDSKGPVSNGKDQGQAGNNQLQRGPGAIDYIRQILDFSVGGASLFRGLTGVR